MPHSREGVERVLHEARQFGIDAGLGVRVEAGQVQLHQVIWRDLLGAVLTFGISRNRP